MSVQNDFIRKLFLTCRGLSYDNIPSGSDRAKLLSLSSVQTRRGRAHLVMLLKVLTERFSDDPIGFFFASL